MAFELFRTEFLVEFIIGQQDISLSATDQQINSILLGCINLDPYLNSFFCNNFSVFFAALGLWRDFLFEKSGIFITIPFF